MSPDRLKEEHFNFTQVSRNEKAEIKPVSLLEWLQDNPMLDLLTVTEDSDSGGIFQELSFRLAGKASAQYPLLKGMFSSGRPKQLALQADDASKIIFLRFDKADETGAYQYISRVLSIIDEEVRFRQVLRKVIENQQRFVLEEKLLLNELKK
ncbi:MAG TPA: hypothetical protein VKZ51_06190 [Cyclobacteriaceae bacterium]|nr:hypothetical protein [Cyclobacteriaceae bacterium]